MIWAVAINSVVIFALYFPALEDIWWLEWLDHFFIATFLIEAAIKIRTYGWQNYWSSYWNRFDLTIVLGSVPTLLTGLLPLPDTSLLVVLRLLRLLRMVRFLRFVPNISHVLDGLGRALKASVFVIIALLFLNVLLALVSCQLYAEVAPEYFGNPVVALYSIFPDVHGGGLERHCRCGGGKVEYAVFRGAYAHVFFCGGAAGRHLWDVVGQRRVCGRNDDGQQ